jgi:hypothetical protein
MGKILAIVIQISQCVKTDGENFEPGISLAKHVLSDAEGALRRKGIKKAILSELRALRASLENTNAKVRKRSRRPGSVIPAKAGIQARWGAGKPRFRPAPE